jgi:hypothetical protein
MWSVYRLVAKNNESFFDIWSVLHAIIALILTCYIGPGKAFIYTLAFEVVESFGMQIQSKPAWFWREQSRNRWIGDIFANLIGIFLALIFIC